METKSTTRHPFTVIALGLWITAAITFFNIEAVHVTSFLPVFESLELDLPAHLVLILEIGYFLRSTVGWLTALVLIGVSVLPYLLGSRNLKMGKRYRLAAVAMFVISGIVYAAITIPMHQLHAKLQDDSPEHSSPR